jgi:hypothetical protein
MALMQPTWLQSLHKKILLMEVFQTLILFPKN